MLLETLLYFLAAYFLTGNVTGVTLIAYLLARYGRKDAREMVELLAMWDIAAFIGAVVSLGAITYIPPEAFIALVRALRLV